MAKEKKITIDPITAMILEQNQQAIQGYEDFLKVGGDFKEMISKAKPGIVSRYISADAHDYIKLKENIAFEIGQQLKTLRSIATTIKTLEVRLEYEYIDSWRFCAQAVPDHPDMAKRRKFCEDYRENEPRWKWEFPYRVGDEVTSNQVKGCFEGKVIAIEDDGLLHVEMTPTDHRRKKKVIFAEPTSLNFFPDDWRRLKGE